MFQLQGASPTILYQGLRPYRPTGCNSTYSHHCQQHRT